MTMTAAIDYSDNIDALLFGDDINNDDLFNPFSQNHDGDHNYATMPPAQQQQPPVEEPVNLMTPTGCDDLAFVGDDLVPFGYVERPAENRHQYSISSSVSSSLDVAIQLNHDEQHSYGVLPDLCALVDKDTLMEALCMVDMPSANAESTCDPSLFLLPADVDSDPQQNLVTTLFDFFASTTEKIGGNTTKRPTRKTSILPMYADESSSGEDSGNSSSSYDIPSVKNHHARSNNFAKSSFSSSANSSEVDVVTEEEREMMAREGVYLPVPENPDEPVMLTAEQERVLKTVRRKMRNKESAKESRKRKANYIETLEKRVKIESQSSAKLKYRVHELEQENEALSARLQYMQGFVQKLIGGMKRQVGQRDQQPTQKSTCIFVMIFALCLVMAPRNSLLSPPNSVHENGIGPAFNSASSELSPQQVLDLGSQNPGLAPNHRLTAQSFIFTYEPATIAERAVDL